MYYLRLPLDMHATEYHNKSIAMAEHIIAWIQ